MDFLERAYVSNWKNIEWWRVDGVLTELTGGSNIEWWRNDRWVGFYIPSQSWLVSLDTGSSRVVICTQLKSSRNRVGSISTRIQTRRSCCHRGFIYRVDKNYSF
ncbi:Uncharacterized protein TCM_001505 [Theobroma cacao]|uniref:Uncharacterized protein n=1 Tax=Theobroma cacao TaxID=3641 RepID=A0A061DRI9_THECC|nr:Uncharacterized protein TCM_001505 [Theobroma cacao]